jgi:hypothetical protein
LEWIARPEGERPNTTGNVPYTIGGNPTQYNQGTFYTYDIEGNVDTLLQDYGSTSTGVANIMNKNGNRFKRLVYQYDLVSGKVNSVAYQPHQVDAFYHRYSYDAENRLVLAETSQDSVYWDKDARYDYYKHGPLARETIGDKQVQGLDYAYTLQGWLKGVNSTSLSPVYDMGGDGDTSHQNRYIARDAYGYNAGVAFYSVKPIAIGAQRDFSRLSPFEFRMVVASPLNQWTGRVYHKSIVNWLMGTKKSNSIFYSYAFKMALICFLDISCSMHHGYKELLQSPYPADICEAAFHLGENKDTTAVELLFQNILDRRSSTDIRYKGLTVCYCKLGALRKISGLMPPHKLSPFTIDSMAVEYYLT